MSGEGRPGPARAVRVARVARREHRGTAPTGRPERGGHRQLRHHRVGQLERHDAGGRPARAVGDGCQRAGRVRRQSAERQETGCAQHGQLSSDQFRRPSAKPVSLLHYTCL